MTLPQSALQMRSLITAEGTLEMSLQEVPVPAPAADEVLLRIEAAPINPSDIGLLFGAADLSTMKVAGTAERPLARAQVPAAAMKAMAGRVGQSLPCGNEASNSCWVCKMKTAPGRIAITILAARTVCPMCMWRSHRSPGWHYWSINRNCLPIPRWLSKLGPRSPALQILWPMMAT